MSSLPYLQLRSPAKINWFLSVMGKREDGYHDISTVMQMISLYDTITLEHSEAIEVSGNTDIPEEENLIYKAAMLLKIKTSYQNGARIVFNKAIPIFAGLGGGSSNAAYTLIGLNNLWRCGLSMEDLASIGFRLGSDVPFFFNGPLAHIMGKGDKITALNSKSSCIILIVKPSIDVSSGWAYANVTKLTKKANNIKLFSQALNEKNFVLLSSFKNDLEYPVFKKYPILGEIKNRLTRLGAVFSSMTGSGAAVFGVFRTVKEAESAAANMASNWCMVIETIDDSKNMVINKKMH